MSVVAQDLSTLPTAPAVVRETHSEENMRAIVKTAREYGQKPSPAVGRLS